MVIQISAGAKYAAALIGNFSCNNKTIGGCSGNGICVADDVCHCSPVYYGESCEFPICQGIKSNDSNVCSSHGNCTAADICSCNTSYSGENCELFSCFGKSLSDPTVCSSEGRCVDSDKCVCNGGYQGENCQQRILILDLITNLCNDSCTLNKTFWYDCLFNQGASCYCGYSNENVTILCSGIDVTHM